MFFPVFIDIKDKKCLVIGAGKVALRKINKLLEYECSNITVISDKISKEIMELKKLNKINLIEDKFELHENSLEKYFLVIAATNDKELNNRVADLCIKKNILVNNTVSKDNMNVRFCTIIENKEYSIGISANGNPEKALELKEKIKNYLDNNT